MDQNSMILKQMVCLLLKNIPGKNPQNNILLVVWDFVFEKSSPWFKKASCAMILITAQERCIQGVTKRWQRLNILRNKSENGK